MSLGLEIDYVLAMAAWLALLAASLGLLLGRRLRWRTSRPARIKWINIGLSVWIDPVGFEWKLIWRRPLDCLAQGYR